jgi:hypothetical protein
VAVIRCCNNGVLRDTYWCSNKPINVSNVEHFTVRACNFGVASHEFDDDSSVSQVGCHGEVGNGSNEGDGGGDVMESKIRITSLMLKPAGVTKSHERRKSHQSGDRPVNVRSMGGDVDLGRVRVMEHVGICLQRVAGSFGDVRHLDCGVEECGR